MSSSRRGRLKWKPPIQWQLSVLIKQIAIIQDSFSETIRWDIKQVVIMDNFNIALGVHLGLNAVWIAPQKVSD